MEKQILLRTKNLQKYFSIKSGSLFSLKKEYVKANKNISLDIYKGETLGIVGESGCGKSTFGRTLIQLQRQTGGASLYYGETINDLMPSYVKKVYKNLQKTSKKYDRDLMHVNNLKKAFKQALEGEKEFKEEVYRLAKIDFDNKYYNTFRLIGGLAVYPDLKKVSNVMLQRYKVLRKLAKLNRKLKLYDIKEQMGTRINKKNQDLIKECVLVLEKEAEIFEIKLNDMKKEVIHLDKFKTYESYADKGIDLASLKNSEARKLRDDLQIIFQDPYSSLDPRMTVGDIIGEGLLIHGIFKSKRSNGYKEYVLDIMDKCGLDASYISRYPHQFSGGQRQRVGIARALALRPKFVVCDEAVSALDVSIQSQIINLLQSLKDNFDLTYLFITHDLGVVKHISDRIGVMYFGNLVELAPAEEIFKNPRHPYTKQLLNAIPTLEYDEVKKNLWEIKYEDKDFIFTYQDGHQDKDWHEVSTGHFVACTLKDKKR